MATTVTAATECGICIEKFNKSRRKRIVCTFCPTDGTETPVCIGCVKTYLLQDDSSTPRCPSCRSGWNEDFLSQTFPKCWLLKEYKAHREHVLLDMERAKLPETQEDAAQYRKALQIIERVNVQTKPFIEQMNNLPEYKKKLETEDVYFKQVRIHRTLQDELNKKINTCLNQKRTILSNKDESTFDSEFVKISEKYLELEKERKKRIDEHQVIERKLWLDRLKADGEYNVVKQPLQKKIRELQNNIYRQALKIRKSYGLLPQGRGGDAATVAKTRWSFVMKCSATGCEGFVGMNWKCGLCEITYCKDCGETKAAEDHMCNPDTRLTHLALRKEAKPCPKCAAMISKIDGCDQMWCTQCHVAFSWRTGQIETSHIHNPHYFHWMRETGNTLGPRPPVLENGDCVNLAPDDLIQQIIFYMTSRRNWEVCMWARSIRHYFHEQRIQQRLLAEKRDDEWRRQLRVRRLVNEITDDIWKDRLQRGEKMAQKLFSEIQILELYIQAGLDILRESLQETSDVPAILKQMETLRKFCNEQMSEVEKRFKNEVRYIEIPHTRNDH